MPGAAAVAVAANLSKASNLKFQMHRDQAFDR